MAASTTLWLNGLGQGLAISGVTQTPKTALWNFASGVTAVYNVATGAWDLTVGGSGSAHVIQDEGTPLTQRSALNFVGVNVAVTDVSGVTTVTIGAVSLAGSGVTGTLTVAHGGTGLGALGTALQVLRVNAGATALEFATATGHTVEDEGTPVTARTSLNFVGVNVAVTDSGGKTVVTIGSVSLTAGVSGTLPIANGGTGLTALGTALQSVRVNAGATALEYYTPGAGLTGPANPADDNKLAIASAGNLTYALGVNANFSASCALAFSKLASATAGQWLTADASGVIAATDVTLSSKTVSYSAADAVGAGVTLRKSRGTSASPTAHNADDVLGFLLYQGRDGSAFYPAGQIRYKGTAAGGTSKHVNVESTAHDGTAEVVTGNFRRFPRTTTTDATLTTISATLASIAIPADSTVKLSIIWHGQQSSNIAHRETSLTVRRSGSGNVVEISHSDSVALFKDDGSWGDETQIAYVLNNTSHAVDFTVQGKSATTIVWTGEVAFTVYS